MYLTFTKFYLLQLMRKTVYMLQNCFQLALGESINNLFDVALFANKLMCLCSRLWSLQPGLHIIYNYNTFPQTMAFVARQNRLLASSDPPARNFGRGPHIQIDQGAIEHKLTKQEEYKLQLQRQMRDKQERKKQEEEKIRREDERINREIEEIQRKEREKEKPRPAVDQNRSGDVGASRVGNSTKQIKNSRIVGSLSVGLRQLGQREPLPEMPKLGFDNSYRYDKDLFAQQSDRVQRKRPSMLGQDYETDNQYYEQRIRRHKQQLNQKLDELFKHIHSTKDNIRADEQIEKIKRKLQSKNLSANFLQFDPSQNNELESENRFYQVPNKNIYSSVAKSPSGSRMLQYQSSSRYTLNKNSALADSRSKVKTQYDDLYSLPQNKPGRQELWGAKPTEGKFLGQREALDFMIAKNLDEIDQYQQYLKRKANQ